MESRTPLRRFSRAAGTILRSALSASVFYLCGFRRSSAYWRSSFQSQAGFGVARIKIDDSLSQLFRSYTPEFKLYERETRLFPSSEFDVLIVLNGNTLLERSSIEKLRYLVIEMGSQGFFERLSGPKKFHQAWRFGNTATSPRGATAGGVPRIG
jgi:hypothetical protein